FPGFGADVLPAGNLFEDEEADLVAAVQEVARLGIVRGAHAVAVQAVVEDLRILPLHARRHGLADKGEGLMAIQSTQLDDLAVEGEAVIGEGSLAESYAAGVLIDDLAGAEKLHVHGVELRPVELPELDVFEPGEGDGVPRGV